MLEVLRTNQTRLFQHDGKKYLYRKMRLTDGSHLSVLGEVQKDFILPKEKQSGALDRLVPNKLIAHRVIYGADGQPVAFSKYKDMHQTKPGLRVLNLADASKIKLIELIKEDDAYRIMVQGDYKSNNYFSRVETMIPKKRILKNFSDVADVKTVAKKFIESWIEMDCCGKFGELFAIVRQIVNPEMEKLSLSEVFKMNNRLIRRFLSLKK